MWRCHALKHIYITQVIVMICFNGLKMLKTIRERERVSELKSQNQAAGITAVEDC